MGFNLGGFAGGLAQGYQAGEKLNLMKAEGARLDKRAEREDQEFQFQQTQREQAKKLQTDLAEIQKSFLMPQEIDEPATADDGMGGVAQVTKKRTVKPDPNDPALQMRMLHAMTARTMQDKADPATLKSFFEYGNKLRATEEGATMLAATRGDRAAMEKVAAQFGGDVSKMKIVTDEGSGRIYADFGEGKRQDLTMALQISGGMSLAEASEKAAKEKREAQTFQVGVDEKKSAINKNNAYTDQVIPAQVSNLKAEAGLRGAQAAVAGQEKKDRISNSEITRADAILKAAYPGGKDPFGSDKASPLYQYAARTVLSAEPGTERKAASSAMERITATMGEAAQRVKQMDEATRRLRMKQAGVTTPDALAEWMTASSLSTTQLD